MCGIEELSQSDKSSNFALSWHLTRKDEGLGREMEKGRRYKNDF